MKIPGLLIPPCSQPGLPSLSRFVHRTTIPDKVHVWSLTIWWEYNCCLQDPGAKNAASPRPPSGGGAFKNIDDDEVIHFLTYLMSLNARYLFLSPWPRHGLIGAKGLTWLRLWKTTLLRLAGTLSSEQGVSCSYAYYSPICVCVTLTRPWPAFAVKQLGWKPFQVDQTQYKLHAVKKLVQVPLKHLY